MRKKHHFLKTLSISLSFFLLLTHLPANLFAAESIEVGSSGTRIKTSAVVIQDSQVALPEFDAADNTELENYMRTVFRYFFDLTEGFVVNGNPVTDAGIVGDPPLLPQQVLLSTNSSEQTPIISIPSGQAASVMDMGLAITALTVGLERNFSGASVAAISDRIEAILTFFHRARTHNGFFYSHYDLQTGEPVPGSEVLTLDTAFFLAGALHATQFYLYKPGASFGLISLNGNTQNRRIFDFALELYDRVDWEEAVVDHFSAQRIALGWREGEEGTLEIITDLPVNNISDDDLGDLDRDGLDRFRERVIQEQPLVHEDYGETAILYILAINALDRDLNTDINVKELWQNVRRNDLSVFNQAVDLFNPSTNGEVSAVVPSYIEPERGLNAHFYNHLWVDFRSQRDSLFYDYFLNTSRATLANRTISKQLGADDPQSFGTYAPQNVTFRQGAFADALADKVLWGISESTFFENGVLTRREFSPFDDSSSLLVDSNRAIVSPTAMMASINFARVETLTGYEVLKALEETVGANQIFTPYGLVSSLSLNGNIVSSSNLGQVPLVTREKAAELIMLDNFLRTEEALSSTTDDTRSVWFYFNFFQDLTSGNSQTNLIQDDPNFLENALQGIGFDSSNYNPTYDLNTIAPGQVNIDTDNPPISSSLDAPVISGNFTRRNQRLNTYSFLVSWFDQPGANLYEIEGDFDSNFSSPHIHVFRSANQFDGFVNEDQEKIYFRVRALTRPLENGGQVSPWSNRLRIHADLDQGFEETPVGQVVVGGSLGGGAGMLIGAAIGTLIAPGVGTGVGAALGFVAGAVAGAVINPLRKAFSSIF